MAAFRDTPHGCLLFREPPQWLRRSRWHPSKKTHKHALPPYRIPPNQRKTHTRREPLLIPSEPCATAQYSPEPCSPARSGSLSNRSMSTTVLRNWTKSPISCHLGSTSSPFKHHPTAMSLFVSPKHALEDRRQTHNLCVLPSAFLQRKSPTREHSTKRHMGLRLERPQEKQGEPGIGSRVFRKREAAGSQEMFKAADGQKEPKGQRLTSAVLAGQCVPQLENQARTN